MYDAIVVGGGIVGMSTAYHLVSSGARTLLLDRDDVGKATWAGAGILSPETSSNESETWFELALAAIAYYPNLIAALAAQGAGETGYARMEQLIVAVSEDEDAPFAALAKRMRVREQQRGQSPDDLQEIDAHAARKFFPALAPLRHVLLFRRAARVDGRLLTDAMRQAALQRGLEIRKADVQELEVADQTVSGVSLAGERISSSAVVIAGGAWSSKFAVQLDVQIPIEPQRGQIIHLSLPGTNTSHFPIITPFHGHYILPFAERRIVVGATREFVGFEPNTTAAGIRQVLGEALRVAPGLADATIAEIRVGLRPATPDHLPILGAIPHIKNVYLAAGHGATGLQLGPYSGKLIADLISDRATEFSLDGFSVTRFAKDK